MSQPRFFSVSWDCQKLLEVINNIPYPGLTKSIPSSWFFFFLFLQQWWYGWVYHESSQTKKCRIVCPNTAKLISQGWNAAAPMHRARASEKVVNLFLMPKHLFWLVCRVCKMYKSASGECVVFLSIRWRRKQEWSSLRCTMSPMSTCWMWPSERRRKLSCGRMLL